MQSHFVDLTLNLEFMMNQVSVGVKQTHQRKQENIVMHINALQSGNGNTYFKMALIEVVANSELASVSHMPPMDVH